MSRCGVGGVCAQTVALAPCSLGVPLCTGGSAWAILAPHLGEEQARSYGSRGALELQGGPAVFPAWQVRRVRGMLALQSWLALGHCPAACWWPRSAPLDSLLPRRWKDKAWACNTGSSVQKTEHKW